MTIKHLRLSFALERRKLLYFISVLLGLIRLESASQISRLS